MDPGPLRIGLRTRRFTDQEEPHPECRRAAEETARLLESLGHEVEEGGPGVLERKDAFSQVGMVFMISIARELDRWSARIGRTIGRSDVEPTTWLFAESGRSFSAAEFFATTETLHRESRELASWWHAGFDLLLTPMVGDLTPQLGPLGPGGGEPGEVIERWLRFSPYATPFNVSGQPAISLPLHWSADGMPLGVQLVAAYGREDLLIRVASQLEAAKPWRDRLPEIHAAHSA